MLGRATTVLRCCYYQSLFHKSLLQKHQSLILRPFSVVNRPPPSYDGHVPLTGSEKAFLGIGSALGAFFNPRRADLVAVLGEVTAGPFIRTLRDTMLLSETGRSILRDRPRISSKTLPLEELRSYPESTVGRIYVKWLDDYRMSPDARDTVQYIDDEECAYVMQRYRECHDLYHSLLGIPPYVEGEVALKAFEFANTGLPMTALSMFAVTRLKPEERRRFFNIYLLWAIRNGLNSELIINVYWEKELRTSIDTLLAKLCLQRPPDLREIRRKERMRKAENGAQKA